MVAAVFLEYGLDIVNLARLEGDGGGLLTSVLFPLLRIRPAVVIRDPLLVRRVKIATQPQLAVVIGSNPERVFPAYDGVKVARYAAAEVFATSPGTSKLFRVVVASGLSG